MCLVWLVVFSRQSGVAFGVTIIRQSRLRESNRFETCTLECKVIASFSKLRECMLMLEVESKDHMKTIWRVSSRHLIGKFSSFFSILVSLFIPVYHSPLSRKRVVGLSELEKKSVISKFTFFYNLSFILEPAFRMNVYSILQDWLCGNETYENSKQRLTQSLEQRGGFAQRITPSYGIQQELRAYGFFSISFFPEQRFPSYCVPGLPVLTSKLGVLRRAGIVTGRRVLEDILAIRNGSMNGVSLSTVNYLSEAAASRCQLTQDVKIPCAVIAPGPRDGESDFSDFGIILGLLTSNTSLKSLESLVNEREISVLANGDFVRNLEITQDKEWVRLLRKCKNIYAKPHVRGPLEQIVQRPVKSGENRLSHLWGSVGHANLGQYAAGLLIDNHGTNVDITFFGATLYVGPTLYSTEESPNESNKSFLGDFISCTSQAIHNPVQNFLLMKNLQSLGLLSRKSSLSKPLKLMLEEYLLELDSSLGKKRA